MNITLAQAFYGLRAIATPTGTNISNDVQIGVSNQVETLTGADVAYSMRAIVTNASNLALNLLTGDTNGSDAWVAGAAQVETATAAGTITASGNASVVVTAAGMTGSPKTISVAVVNGDTAATWAGKVRTALAADTAVSAMFTVGGSTTAISLTRLHTDSFDVKGTTVYTYAANDATLNIALDNGTCTGITTAATSADTTAGVVTSGIKIVDASTDFEGDTLPTIVTLQGILYDVAVNHADASITGGVDESLEIFSGEKMLRLFGSLNAFATSIVCTSNGPADFTITVIGKTS